MSDNIVNRYGALWDGENAACTRMYNAVGKVAAAHMGTFDAGLINDFDSIYPWSGMCLCNWAPGTATEKAKITAFEGEPGYDATANLGAYRPEFWYSIEPQADGGILFVVADGKLPGYHYSPPYMLTAFCVADDGNGGLQCKPGDVQYNSISLNSYNSKNAAQGMLTEDYWADGAEKLLLTVEFANLNSQAATGSGFVSARYNDDRPAFAELATNRVILTKAAADVYVPEKQTVGIGTTWLGGFKAQHRKIISVTPYENDAAYSCVNFDGDAVDVETTDHVGSMSAIFDGVPVGHGSGYVGANGKAISYYRGAALQTGAWMWVASIMRSSAEEIWVAPTDNPQTGAIGTDWVNTGLTLPSAEGYIKHIAVSKKNPIAMQPDAVGDGANSVMPVGDYLYRPAVGSAATALLSRGVLLNGSYAGAWFGLWRVAPSRAYWDRAARSLIRNPFNTVMPLPPTTETVPISEPITNAAGLVTVESENTLKVSFGGAASDKALRAHVTADTNPHGVTKAQVGLPNVDNTADTDKPVSTAQQLAIGNAANDVLTIAKTFIPNENLSDNSYLINPVNQRGSTSYSTDGYCVDRWALATGMVLNVANHTLTGSNASNNSLFYQRLLGLALGQTYTLSLKVNGELVKATHQLGTDSTEVWETFSWGRVAVYKDGGMSTILIYVNNGTAITVDWVKLELGTVATPYVPKGYGAELAECRRYYLKMDPVVKVYCNDAQYGQPRVSLSLGTVMRVTPTFTLTQGYKSDNLASTSVEGSKTTAYLTLHPSATGMLQSNCVVEASADL